jgi:hypothetical protein
VPNMRCRSQVTHLTEGRAGAHNVLTPITQQARVAPACDYHTNVRKKAFYMYIFMVYVDMSACASSKSQGKNGLSLR